MLFKKTFEDPRCRRADSSRAPDFRRSKSRAHSVFFVLAIFAQVGIGGSSPTHSFAGEAERTIKMIDDTSTLNAKIGKAKNTKSSLGMLTSLGTFDEMNPSATVARVVSQHKQVADLRGLRYYEKPAHRSELAALQSPEAVKYIRELDLSRLGLNDDDLEAIDRLKLDVLCASGNECKDLHAVSNSADFKTSGRFQFATSWKRSIQKHRTAALGNGREGTGNDRCQYCRCWIKERGANAGSLANDYREKKQFEKATKAYEIFSRSFEALGEGSYEQSIAGLFAEADCFSEMKNAAGRKACYVKAQQLLPGASKYMSPARAHQFAATIANGLQKSN